VALPEVLVGFLKANRSRWSKKIRPQRGALNEGSRPSDRLLMKYSCKEWLYLSIHPSILPTTFPHFLLLPSTILWCASFERKKKKKTSTLSLAPQRQTHLYLIRRNPQRV